MCSNNNWYKKQEQTIQRISAQLLNINLLENKDLVADEFLYRKGKNIIRPGGPV